MIPYGRQTIEEEDIKAVVETLKSNFLTTGPKVEEFEKKISEYIGCNHAIVVCNGTAALDLAVAALQLPTESEVIVTPFTFMASANCIIYNNLTPVFCDINEDTLNINPTEIERKVTSKTKAIICVDFAGRPCEMNKINAIAKKYNLYVIEDAAHALGSEFQGKKVGNWADLTTFSFHPVKTITTGEGGMITTNDNKLAERLKILRNHGILKNEFIKNKKYGEDAFYEYDMIDLGRNFRLNDIQCALGISQLNKLDHFIKRRQEIVGLYNKLFDGTEGITTPLLKIDIKNKYSRHLYYILLDKNINKNKFLNTMKKKNIGVHSFYIPIYNFTYYKNRFNIRKEDFPVAEDIFSRIVILPLFPTLTEKEIYYIVNCTKQILKELKNECY